MHCTSVINMNELHDKSLVTFLVAVNPRENFSMTFHVPEVLNVQMNEIKKNRTMFVRNSSKK